MQGRRVADGTEPHLYESGDYGRWGDTWYCRPPYPEQEGEFGPRLGGVLTRHDVVEHDDGTITVSPSILTWTEWGHKRTRHEWHGYLERGVWREC